MTTLLRDGSRVEDARLDRMPSGHTKHLEKYPLTLATMPSTATPVVFGINWYENFDRPVTRKINGRLYWVIGGGNLGQMRGGHAVCLRPWGVVDAPGWYAHYDQGVEGRCVEFAWLRALSLMNRVRYDISSKWHYWEMQRRDFWAGGSYPGGEPHYEGTSVDAGAQVMHKLGAIPALTEGRAVYAPFGQTVPPAVKPEHGIGTYRWSPDWGTTRAVLGVPDWMPGVPLLNSWAYGYPRQVILLDEAGERVQREDGEVCVVTDK